MKTVSFIAATLSAITMSAQLAQAGNAGDSLPACYNHVINACNQSAHPEACAEAGMNACDEYHSAMFVPDVPLNLNYSMRRDGTYVFRAVPMMSTASDDTRRRPARRSAD